MLIYTWGMPKKTHRHAHYICHTLQCLEQIYAPAPPKGSIPCWSHWSHWLGLPEWQVDLYVLLQGLPVCPIDPRWSIRESSQAYILDLFSVNPSIYRTTLVWISAYIALMAIFVRILTADRMPNAQLKTRCLAYNACPRKCSMSKA